MASRREPRCSIVIRAFNEEEHLGRLLSGIANQTVSRVEVLVVDSGSTDGTREVASRFPVRLLSIPPASFTFGRSLNLGCRAARADLIVIASAHVYPVYSDWLEKLLEPFRDRRVGLVYGKQRGDVRTRYSESMVFRKAFPESSVPSQLHPFCNNANAAIRKSLWKKRPYDADLPGLEDLEWATWALGAGHVLAYAAEAEVIHIHDETPQAVFNRYRREAMALRKIHPHSHFRLTDFVRLFTANVFSDAWHALGDRRLHRNAAEIIWFRWMQFWGTYRGFALAGPLTKELQQAFFYPHALARVDRISKRETPPLDYVGLEARPPRRLPRAAARRARSRRARVNR